MDLQVPLNRLKFGHQDGAGINARVVGREDGIAGLAANIHANGQIENLIVKDAGGGFYSVANGNRRLAAFHMIYGADSSEPINCTLHDVDETKGFEFSLTTAVTAEQLHPVDQYEGFARLHDRGQTDEEIARKYGLSEREVEQALALGHLSPAVRDAWRKGEIKASAAKAFTLAGDHKAQDEALGALRDDMDRSGRDGSDFDDSDVKEILKIDAGAGVLVEFVGIDAYVARGGKVTPDLFGTDHKVADAKLARTMADEKLAEECKKLKEDGWGFAVTKHSVRNTHWDYGRLKAEAKPTDEEQARLDQLEALFDVRGDLSFDRPSLKDLPASAQAAFLEHRELTRTVALRPYTAKMKEKAGCFVDIDDEGMLTVEYGRVKPAQKEQAAKVEKEERKEQKKADAKAAKAEGKAAPAPTTLSNALKQRLEMWLVAATRDAIAGEPQLVNSPLFEILAKITCAQIVADRAWGTPDAIRTKFPSIRQFLNPGVFNAAIAKRFDAEDYFSNAPRGLVIKAIAEAINPDEARKASTGKTKAEIWKFALANLGKTGWLPKELRTVHYKGPGSEGYKPPAAAPQATPPAADKAAAKPTTAQAVAKAKHDRTAKAGEVRLKRAAVAKKPEENVCEALIAEDGQGQVDARGIARGRRRVPAAIAGTRGDRARPARRRRDLASARSARPVFDLLSPRPSRQLLAGLAACPRHCRCQAPGARQDQRLAQCRRPAAEWGNA
jgi:ParB family transcriptional regulator, chromosome partitioning protein